MQTSLKLIVLLESNFAFYLDLCLESVSTTVVPEEIS